MESAGTLNLGRSLRLGPTLTVVNVLAGGTHRRDVPPALSWVGLGFWIELIITTNKGVAN